MESKAIPLIISDRDGYRVSEQGLDFLQSIDGKVGVVAVVGKYRTGKSFLLNRVLLDHKEGRGFGVGPTINPCTKGIWIWNETIPIENSDGETMKVIVMDSEGLGAFDEDANHDSKIFLLSLLLSSYFVYNSVGNIDENALQSLSLIVNLSKQLQIRLNGAPADPDELSSYFPSFMWVLRDFALRLVDSQDNAISTKQYLENSLACQRGVSDNIEAKNRIRRVLTNFFKDRDCFALVRPTESESALQRLDVAPDEVFRPEFLDQAHKLRRLVFRKVRPKTLNGQFLNGGMLAELALAYTEAINKGSIPNIEGAWTNVCQAECQKGLETAMKHFETKIKELPLPMSDSEFESHCARLLKDCLGTLKDKLLGDSTEAWVEQFENTMAERKKIYSDKNDKVSVATTEQAANGWWKGVLDRLKTFEITDLSQLKSEIEEFSSSNQPINTKSLVFLLEFKSKVFAEGAEYISRCSAQQLGNENKRLLQQIESLREQLNRRKEDFESEKGHLKKRIEEHEKELYTLRASQTTSEMRQEELQREKGRIEETYQERIDCLKENFRDKIEQLKGKNAELQQKINQLQTKLQQVNSTSSQETALLKQELEFTKKENESLRQRLTEEPKQKNASRTRFSVSEMPEADWSAEKEYLLGQIQALKSQVEDNRTVQETLMSALNKNSENPSLDKAYETNKHLSYALSKMEERCTQLEGKLAKLKKLKKSMKHSSGLQCKKCLKCFSLDTFNSHCASCTCRRVDENSPLQISITQTIIQEDDKPFTEYLVAVSCSNENWTVNRRFKMFCNLHLALQQHFPHVNLPDASSIFSTGGALSKRPLMLEERKKGIQAYLMKLSKIQEVRESQTFAKFIGLDEANTQETSLALSPIINRSDF